MGDAPDAIARTSPPTVLIAEDDHDLRVLIATLMALEGFVVSEASDGKELVEIVRAALREDGAAPDLLISDLVMPGLDGIEAIEQLQEQVGHLRVIVITGSREARDREAARRIGAVRILDKPFDLDVLRASVLVAMAQRDGDAR